MSDDDNSSSFYYDDDIYDPANICDYLSDEDYEAVYQDGGFYNGTDCREAGNGSRFLNGTFGENLKDDALSEEFK